MPSWLVSSLLTSLERRKEYNDLHGTDCELWRISELKVLSFIISSLQNQILKEPYHAMYTININGILKEISCDLSKINSLLARVLSGLGGIRFFTKKQKTYEASFLFVKEQFDKKNLYLKANKEGQEFILGISSSYTKWLQRVVNQDLDKTQHENESVLAINKSLWLELRSWELFALINFEKSCQEEKNLVQFPKTFNIDLLSLLSEHDLSNKAHNRFFKKIQKINLLLKKMNYHGCTNLNKVEEALWINQKVHTVKAVWQTKTQYALNDMYEYKQSVSSFFVKETLSSQSKFFKFMGLGLKKEALEKLQILFMDKIKNELDFYAKDFIEDSKCSLSPCILVFIELCLRSYSNHLVPLAEETKFYFFPKEINESNLKASYESFLLLLNKEISFKETLVKDSLFLWSDTQILGSKIRNNFIKNIEILLNTESTQVDNNAYTTQDCRHFPQVIKTTNLTPKLEKANKDNPIFPTKQQEIEKMDNLYKKSVIDQQLTKIRSNSNIDYQKLKELYYNSLNEKSQNIIMTLEKKMKQDLFNRQIQQRLVTFIFNNPHNPMIKSLQYFTKNDHYS